MVIDLLTDVLRTPDALTAFADYLQRERRIVIHCPGIRPTDKPEDARLVIELENGTDDELEVFHDVAY